VDKPTKKDDFFTGFRLLFRETKNASYVTSESQNSAFFALQKQIINRKDPLRVELTCLPTKHHNSRCEQKKHDVLRQLLRKTFGESPKNSIFAHKTGN